jgi:hypothetical protein
MYVCALTVCAYTCLHTYVCLRVHLFVSVCLSMCVRLCMFVCVCLFLCVCLCVSVCVLHCTISVAFCIYRRCCVPQFDQSNILCVFTTAHVQKLAKKSKFLCRLPVEQKIY